MVTSKGLLVIDPRMIGFSFTRFIVMLCLLKKTSTWPLFTVRKLTGTGDHTIPDEWPEMLTERWHRPVCQVLTFNALHAG